MAEWCLEGAVLDLLVGEIFNSHSCQDAESWVVLLDFNSLPQETLQLGLCPSHFVHEMEPE